MPLLFALAAAAAAQGGLPPALVQAVSNYDLAQEKGDGPALRRLLADDYLLVNSGGSVETKEDFIADLTSPDYHLDPFKVVRPVSRVWPGGAVMGGVASLRGSSGGQTFSACLRFVDVWRLNGGRWQVAYSQAAKAAGADCAGTAPSTPAAGGH